jgi:hypothetical protein
MTESGLGPHFLNHLHEPMRMAVDLTWFPTLWEFVQENDIALHNNTMQPTKIENANYIMAKAISCRVHNLPLFNLCRIYLQIEHMSEIIYS